MGFEWKGFTDKGDSVLIDIAEYAKLAISITHKDFQAALLGSTLIPNQWYLITDYTTYRFVVGQVNDYYRGPVEPIYIQALDVNKVAPLGWSKSFPDEQITYTDRQSITYRTFNVSASLSGGVPTGNYTMTVSDPTHIVLTGLPKPINEGFGFYISITDVATGDNLYFNDSNRDIDWEIDIDGNFHLLQTSYTVDVRTSVYWNTNDGNLDTQEIDVLTDTEIQALGPVTRFDDFLRNDAGAGISIYDDAGGSIYFDFINKGEVWDIIPLSGNIEILKNGIEVQGSINYNPIDGSTGDYTLAIESATDIFIDALLTIQKGTYYNGTTNINIVWTDASSTYLDFSNYGVDWTYTGSMITLIGNTHDLENDLDYIDGYIIGNSTDTFVNPYSSSYAEISMSLLRNLTITLDLENDINVVSEYSYFEYVYGYISARYHIKKKFFWDADFRGRKLRRYGLVNVGTYVGSTTYTYNQVVIYNGTYYLCFYPSTTAIPTTNSRWVAIGPAEQIYGAINYSGYTGLQVLYDNSSYSDIDYFNISSFNSLALTTELHVSVKCSNSTSTDLSFYIRNFGPYVIFESDIIIGGLTTLVGNLRNSTGYTANSIIRDMTSSNVNLMSNCIALISASSIKSINGVFTVISGCDITYLNYFVGTNITGSTLLNCIMMLCTYGCDGNVINYINGFYCDVEFKGNTILNSSATSMNTIILINKTGYLSSFSGNVITAQFTNVAMQCRQGFTNNKVFSSFDRIDWKLDGVNDCKFYGTFANSQIDNDSSGSINSSSFSGSSNTLFSNGLLNFNTDTFSSTLSLVSSLCAFEFSGVTVLPTVDSYYTYPRDNINLTIGTGNEAGCRVRAIYLTSGSPYSGIMLVATRRRPKTSGTLGLYSGGGQPSISYTNAYKMFSMNCSTSSTPLPAIGDVYSYGGNYYWYAGKNDTLHMFVGKVLLSGTVSLTRVSGAGANPMVINVSGESTTIISSSFFASVCFLQLGTFGATSINNSIFMNSLNNSASVEAATITELKQYNQFPTTLQGGGYKFSINTAVKTSNYTTNREDENILCRGVITITLQSALYLDGKVFNIKNIGDDTVTINTTSSQTIDGLTTQYVYPNECMKIFAYGSAWYIL